MANPEKERPPWYKNPFLMAAMGSIVVALVIVVIVFVRKYSVKPESGRGLEGVDADY